MRSHQIPTLYWNFEKKIKQLSYCLLLKAQAININIPNMNFKLQCKNFIAITLFISLFAHQNVAAQDTIKSITINLQLTHFIAKNQKSSRSFIPINPGIEMLYNYPLGSKTSVSTGVNYSFSKWRKSAGTSQRIRYAHEVTIPLLFERYLGHKIYITVGSYAGWLVSGKIESYSKNIALWVKNTGRWVDVTKHSDYDETSKFTCDLYLGIGFLLKGNPKHQIILEPFIKYKIKDNWMGEVRTKTYFGLNIKVKNLMTR